MIRKDLESSLKLAALALSTSDIVPIYRCFCFGADTVTAYDERVGVQAPCEGLGVEGALDGQLLQKWVRAMSAEEIEVTQSKGGVTLRAGRSRLKLPVTPASAFMFAFPTRVREATIGFSADGFMQAIQMASTSVGLDPAQPLLFGITLMFGGDGLTLYASNNAALTSATLECAVPDALVNTSVIMTPRLVEILYKTRSQLYDNMTVSKDSLSFTTESGVLVNGRCPRGSDPDQFLDVMEQFDWTAEDGWADVTEDLVDAVKRATLVGDAPEVVIKVRGGVATLSTKSSRGACRDKVALPGHADADICAVPSTLLPGLEFGQQVKIESREGLLLRAPGFRHVVSALVED